MMSLLTSKDIVQPIRCPDSASSGLWDSKLTNQRLDAQSSKQFANRGPGKQVFAVSPLYRIDVIEEEGLLQT
jgi:hypothetical protein